MPKNNESPKELLPLSQEEMDELDDFLMPDIASDESMMLDILLIRRTERMDSGNNI